MFYHLFFVLFVLEISIIHYFSTYYNNVTIFQSSRTSETLHSHHLSDVAQELEGLSKHQPIQYHAGYAIIIQRVRQSNSQIKAYPQEKS